MEWIKQAHMLGHELRIKAEESSLWGTRLGEFCERSQTICVNGSCTLSLCRLVSIHELVHAADSLFGLRLKDWQTDMVAGILHDVSVRSPGIAQWLGHTTVERLEGNRTLHLLSSKLLVMSVSSDLWRGPAACVNYQEGVVLVEEAAGAQDQRSGVLYAALVAGLNILHTHLRRAGVAALTEAWLSLLRNSPELTEWWWSDE